MRASRGHQDTLRKYLLGDLEEPARVALDEQIVINPGTFHAVTIAEQALIDEYLDEGLSRVERETFEHQIRTLPGLRKKVRFARQLRAHASSAQPAMSRSSRVFASDHRPILDRVLPARVFSAEQWSWTAVAAVLLIAVMGGNAWLARRQAMQADQLTQLTAQHEQDRSRLRESSAAIRDLQARLASSGRENARLAVPSQTSTPVVAPSPIFVLATGLLRGEGEVTRVSIPAGAQVVRLQLPVRGAQRGEYRAVLFDAEGAEFWTIAKLRATGTPAAVIVTVARDLLPRGDYRLQLMAASEPATAVHTYPFRVTAR